MEPRELMLFVQGEVSGGGGAPKVRLLAHRGEVGLGKHALAEPPGVRRPERRLAGVVVAREDPLVRQAAAAAAAAAVAGESREHGQGVECPLRVAGRVGRRQRAVRYRSLREGGMSCGARRVRCERLPPVEAEEGVVGGGSPKPPEWRE
eukprot:CAMPEP_0174915480 /NCGR_PEP_ID=MMETSP1355-20121228/1122_1 /TAXON_ID=464990 /ORGANISM="Hemiselmis tepida, Strain CCMP443" /LENGTH=148 /DNA_ID=CAMNT_0016160369 /DNA_START=137 /DNA_END=582 /DNA_ORIENTATION=+